MRRALTVLIVLALASPAWAQDPAAIEDVEQVFVRWMKQHGVKRGTLAVAHGDRLVLAKGYGGLTAESRVLIASLSKAITGVCTATLIQQGKLRLDSPLGELLERGAKRSREPRDPRLRAVTVGQLLTHRAGFSRSASDPATGSNLSNLLGRRAVSQTTMDDLVPGVLRAKLEHEPGTTYVYTNAAHLLLGVVIEAVTQERYEDYCGTTVLRPRGIQGATLHPRWRVLGSFGGWSLSGAEYLAFLRAFAPTATVVSSDIREWMLTASGKETTASGSSFYSLLLVRPGSAGGHDFFHAGSWGYRLSAKSPSGPINDSMGTRAMSAAFGASWFAYFEPRPDAHARAALDDELYRAAQAVRAWPATDLYPSLGLR
jgi:CubicO group peptidase (beta-lactamase class C family)